MRYGPDMGNADLTGHWAARLHDIAGQEHVPGSVLGIWADGAETLAAHGVLSTATQVSTTPDSLFQIGSVSKVWTATMIMQLADEGRLALDTPVARLLPGVALGDPDASAEVTVAHLLTHTSGIDGDIFTDTGRGDDCVERYVAGLATAPRIFPPGGGYSYCNSGFVLAGRIIEVLDGRTWDASLRERLTGPLGLGQTVTLAEEAIMHRAATGHRMAPLQGVPASVWGLPRSVGPAGLICSSAHDVLTFARLHLNGGVAGDGTRLLSEESVSDMPRPRAAIPSIGGREAVGLTWRLDHWGGRQVHGHDGRTIGQSAFLRVDPASGVAACLLTNSPEAGRLYYQLFTEIFGHYAGITPAAEPDPEPEPGPGDRTDGAAGADLERHAGLYERTSRRYDVVVRDGRLRVTDSLTDDRAEFSDDGPKEIDLYPARGEAAGSGVFVCRFYDSQPWGPAIFGRLADQTPYIYVGGRVTPRVA